MIRAKPFLSFAMIVSILLASGCGKDDPATPNPVEEFDGIGVSIAVPGALEDFYVLFEDSDDNGVYEPYFGGIEPILYANTLYNVEISPFFNGNILNAEIEDEKDDHLFCYSATNNIMTFGNLNTDSHGKPFGLTSQWTSGEPGSGSITITLRHQPGVKTGDCPGEGEDDFTVSFSLQLVD